MSFPEEDFDPDFAAPYQWAEMYRRRGMQVVPSLAPTKKVPAVAWKHLQHELMSQEQFDELYHPLTGEHRARTGMGVITGPCSGRLYLIDLDTHKGPQALAWWRGVLAVHNNGMELETWEQITGGGGRHLYFRYPEGWKGAISTTTTLGIDTRGLGGFAVLPPSGHISGRAYNWVRGRAPDEIELLDMPPWLCAEVEKLIRDYGGHTGGHTGPAGDGDATPQFNAFGRQTNGRERYMRDLVYAAFVGFKASGFPLPPGNKERDEQWAVYETKMGPKEPQPGESNADGLEREKRGKSLFDAKWATMLLQWDGDKLREAADSRPPEDLAGDFQEKAEQAEEKAKADPGLRYPYLNPRQIKATPDPVWLIDEVVPEKVVGFVFGPPASLKTFIALDMALSMATGQPTWWGKKLNKPGAVVYISSEGIGSLKYRLRAWEQHRRTVADDHPFFLIKETINFMKAEDIGKLLATVQAIKDEAGCEIAAVFVDTVSRVLPGAEENQQKDMTLFVAACDALRQRFDATVIGIHHTNKQGGMRGSTVMPAAGDFVLEVAREPGAMTGTITATKIKDAVDGWALPFKVTEVLICGILPRTSLVVDVEDNPPTEARLPPKDVLRRVLVAMEDAWKGDRPWSDSPRSRGRYAPRHMEAKFNIPVKQGAWLIEEWLDSEAIQVNVHNKHTKMTGLRIKNGID